MNLLLPNLIRIIWAVIFFSRILVCMSTSVCYVNARYMIRISIIDTCIYKYVWFIERYTAP